MLSHDRLWTRKAELHVFINFWSNIFVPAVEDYRKITRGTQMNTVLKKYIKKLSKTFR